MNCQSAREVFTELLDHRTAATAHLEARAHLANCPDCQREFATLTQTARALDTMTLPQPSPRLRRNFYAMLEEEKHSAASVRAVEARRHRVRLWRWILSPLAGCALLALGFALGQRGQTIDTSRTGDDTAKREFALHDKINRLSEQVAQQNEQLSKVTSIFGRALLDQQQSPTTERLNDVLAKAQAQDVNDKVLSDLVLALTLDPSANVRLRALEALARHGERDVVRAGVLTALPREQNPLVQIELIDFVAAAQVSNAAPALEKLSADESANSDVRSAAKLALAQF